MNIEFRLNGSLVEFSDRSYHEAQILIGEGIMNDLDTKIAMEHAIKPFKGIHIAMIPVLNDKNRYQELVRLLENVHIIIWPTKNHKLRPELGQL